VRVQFRGLIMAVQPIDVTGGESVYCFNRYQLESAFELAQSESDSGEKVRQALSTLERTLTRNEQAATAFVLIDRLVRSKPE
jgi:hypothetical protein